MNEGSRSSIFLPIKTGVSGGAAEIHSVRRNTMSPRVKIPNLRPRFRGDTRKSGVTNRTAVPVTEERSTAFGHVG